MLGVGWRWVVVRSRRREGGGRAGSRGTSARTGSGRNGRARGWGGTGALGIGQERARSGLGRNGHTWGWCDGCGTAHRGEGTNAYVCESEEGMA